MTTLQRGPILISGRLDSYDDFDKDFLRAARSRLCGRVYLRVRMLFRSRIIIRRLLTRRIETSSRRERSAKGN